MGRILKLTENKSLKLKQDKMNFCQNCPLMNCCGLMQNAKVQKTLKFLRVHQQMLGSAFTILLGLVALFTFLWWVGCMIFMCGCCQCNLDLDAAEAPYNAIRELRAEARESLPIMLGLGLLLVYALLWVQAHRRRFVRQPAYMRSTGSKRA